MRPARRTVTIAAADLTDPDGVKESFASDDEAVALVPADWDGAVITDAGVLNPPRTITISRSDSAGSYTVDPIVLTGTRGGATVTESLTPADADGDDILVGAQAFDKLLGVSIPEQVNASGAFTIGVQNICAPAGDRFCGVDVHTDGTLYVQYGESAGAPTDAIPVVVAVYRHLIIEPTRILTGANQTVDSVTIYLP